MIKSESENRLFHVIAQQTPDHADLVWLAENNREDMNWPAVAQRAFDEGLAPLLYYHCRDMNILQSIPESTKKFLARIYAETSLINMHLLQEMAELEKGLEKKDIQVIVLKGAALLKTVYRDVALRPMEDIDLMVRQEHLSELKNVLESMGFAQNQLYPGSFGKGILSIDIHSDFISSHRIRSRKSILDISPEDAWSRSVPINGSRSLYRLSLNINLIALSFHLLKHRYDRLIWFVDIAESIKRYQSMSDWKDLIEYSRHVRADRLLLYTLLLTKRLLGAKVPDEVLTALGKDELSPVERYILRLRLMHVPLGTAVDLLWMFQIRGTGKKIRFIRENIFPRSEVMNQIFPGTSHRSGMFLKRAILLSSQVLTDLLMLFAGVLRGGLPPL
ncbi:MAG: nucleotidyltransferase family protein [Desulfobacterales bacterium]|nr:nucleotidyltransferase family protein [Desulfobacterales bacterium]